MGPGFPCKAGVLGGIELMTWKDYMDLLGMSEQEARDLENFDRRLNAGEESQLKKEWLKSETRRKQDATGAGSRLFRDTSDD
jgi:hypothetical protein